MSGASTLLGAIEIGDQLIQLLNSGGLQLRQWSSNDVAVVDSLPANLRTPEPVLHIQTDDTINTLGIKWAPSKDVFMYFVNFVAKNTCVTKRNILSITARLFDPMGWLAPIVVRAKLILQQLLLSGVAWDDPIPQAINREWQLLQSQMHQVNQLKIPRYAMSDNAINIQLDGFSDASQSAHGAVIYIR